MGVVCCLPPLSTVSGPHLCSGCSSPLSASPLLRQPETDRRTDLNSQKHFVAIILSLVVSGQCGETEKKTKV